MRARGIVFASLLTCGDLSPAAPPSPPPAVPQEVTLVTPSPIDTATAMRLPLDKALFTFGRPISKETYPLEDLMGEFYTVLGNAYATTERDRAGITIEEVTWEQDSATNLTVWYEWSGEGAEPRAHLVWPKGAEF